jgi:hexosaminidase
MIPCQQFGGSAASNPMKTTTREKWICGAMLAALCGTAYPEEPVKLPLVPYPRQVELTGGSFTPAGRLALVHDEDGRMKELAETLASDLAVLGFTASHGEVQPGENAGRIRLSLRKDPDLGVEGYRLNIDADVAITAATPDGLFWGTRTLLQLLHAGPGKDIPRLAITDKPEFSYRGLMIDNARNFHSIDFHIGTVKRIAAYKMNRYQIHFSDQQSYTLPSEAFPGLPTEGRHHSAAEIGRLVEAAKRYHVEIVPEIDVPGHAAALIRGIEGLGCDGDGRKICIGRESSYEALEKLFSEVMEMIPGKYWHLGADEVSYSGTRCRGCATGMKDEGFQDADPLFNHFINRMNGFLKGKGRQVLVWEGFSPTADPIVDRDILVCPFDVKHAGKMPDDYFKAGYRVLNTSWSPLYVADRISMTTPEDMALWSPFMFGAGRSPQPFRYWKKYRPEDYLDKIVGAQVCSWEIEEKAEEGLLFGTGPGFHDYGRPGPRVPIVAERVWTGSDTTARDLLERVGASYW